jgi:hypothetical protein
MNMRGGEGGGRNTAMQSPPPHCMIREKCGRPEGVVCQPSHLITCFIPAQGEVRGLGGGGDDMPFCSVAAACVVLYHLTYLHQPSPASYIAQPHIYLPIIGLTQDKPHTVLTLSSYIPQLHPLQLLRRLAKLM